MNELKIRIKKFAHDCVKLAVELPNNHPGRHIIKQLIRCSTSVAANFRTASHGYTKSAFHIIFFKIRLLFIPLLLIQQSSIINQYSK